MKNTVSGKPFRRIAGFTAIGVVCLYVMLCIIVMFAPKSWVRSNRATSLFDRLVVLGPFFQEDRIKSTPHVLVSYKSNNEWSQPADHVVDNFNYYRAHPWRYDKLHDGDFVRNASLRVARLKRENFQDVKDVRAFRELNEFVIQEYVKQPVDSIRIVYGFNVYSLDLKAFQFDTLFQYTYQPQDVAPARKRN